MAGQEGLIPIMILKAQLLKINKVINRHWRDWAGVVYLFICLVDFFIAPLVWNIKMEEHCNDKERYPTGVECKVTRWVPLTLGAGAMFHLSFGAILGAVSYTHLTLPTKA